jgi:hypothetical protein
MEQRKALLRVLRNGEVRDLFSISFVPTREPDTPAPPSFRAFGFARSAGTQE